MKAFHCMASIWHHSVMQIDENYIGSVEQQALAIKTITERNGLKLNVEKLELMSFSKNNGGSKCDMRIVPSSPFPLQTA